MATGQELPININASAMQMARTIFGDDVKVVRASYSGDRLSSGIYTNGDTVSPEVTPGDTGVILTRGHVRNFTQPDGDPNRSASTSYNSTGQNGNPLFDALAGTSTYDAAILTTQFIPTSDFLSIQFTFSSEEYPEFVGTIFNDVVGVWINGQLVTSPVTNFTYTAQNQNGVSDTAHVNIKTVPCFASGTMIRTPQGEVPIDALSVGDMVETRDHGPQALRWIGRRKVAAKGRFAPVVIEAGTFGHHRRLIVSPQHRILLTHWMAELMFGEQKVLVAAKDFINDCSVRIALKSFEAHVMRGAVA